MEMQIVKVVSPDTPRAYRLIETYQTSEGMRTRVCSGSFVSQEEAEWWRESVLRSVESGETK